MMTNVYGQGFARIYKLKWEGFADRIAPRIREFYAGKDGSRANRKILDLCCGTGRLALRFLEHGYPVTGLDISEPMLEYARAAARRYIDAGQAQFVQGDVATFTLDQRFGLVVSTYDALNHLPDEDALTACFERVYAVSDDLFIFDLNTRAGLRQWNGIQLDESDHAVVVTHKTFDAVRGHARARFTCFLRTTEGLYERTEATVFNTAFELDRVADALRSVGWNEVYFATASDLSRAIAEPESEQRVFVVASKGAAR